MHWWPSVASAVGLSILMLSPAAAQSALSPTVLSPTRAGDPSQGVAPLAASAPLPSAMPVARPTDRSRNNEPSTAEDGDAMSQTLAAFSQPDATLRAVDAADADRIVAVGDAGAIWLSTNGGRTWRRADSPTTANLTGVLIDSDLHGVAVGGWIGNGAGGSYGTVLVTADGGETWEHLPHRLPRLLGLHRLGNTLVAWSDYSPLHGTSLFLSWDRGRTWMPQQAPVGHAVAAAGSALTHRVVLFDRLGRTAIAHAVPGTPPAAPGGKSLSDTGPLVGARAMAQVGRGWIAAGVGGRVWSSPDGIAWAPILLPWTETTGRAIDWNCIAQVDGHIWIGGCPGSVLLHSADGGTSWELVETGTTRPLYGIAFLDEQVGWAVGAQGLILATRDGGRSWYAQQGAGRRAALLCSGRTAEGLPWPSLLAAAWEERLRVTALVDGQEELVEAAGFLPTRQMQYAAIAPRLGVPILPWSDAVAAEPDGDTAAERTSTFTDPRPARGGWSTADIVRRAVALATWRASIVLVPDAEADVWELAIQASAPDPAQSNPLWSVDAPTRAAVGQALSELRLPPCTPTKLVCYAGADRDLPPGVQRFTVSQNKFLRRLGTAVWDLLLELPLGDMSGRQDHVQWMRWTSVRNRAADQSLTGAVPIPAEAKLQQPLSELGNYQLVMGRTHRMASLERLAESTSDDATWHQTLGLLIQSTPGREAVYMLWRLAHELSPTRVPQRRIAVLRLLQGATRNRDVGLWAAWEELRMTGSDELRAWQSIVPTNRPDGTLLAAYRPSQSNAGWSVASGQPTVDPISASPFDTPSPPPAPPART
ncbi:MAG: hypothetical protein D6753_18930, partial [Planctomycetota bacterium]